MLRLNGVLLKDGQDERGILGVREGEIMVKLRNKFLGLFGVWPKSKRNKGKGMTMFWRDNEGLLGKRGVVRQTYLDI